MDKNHMGFALAKLLFSLHGYILAVVLYFSFSALI